MAAIRIAFFDDHPILLQGLVNFFQNLEGFEVVAHGETAASICEKVRSTRPDLAIVDLSMPGNVQEAIAEIVKTVPETKVIVFTASTSVEHAVGALEVGASGYVLKGSTAPELASALRVVASGETYLSNNFATKVIAALRNSALRKQAEQVQKLSVREEQIVRLLLRGGTNKEIARHLTISEKTVKHYMSALMQKLNARNRVEVVLAAQELSNKRSPMTMQ